MIIFNEKTKEFHITNGKISYILGILRNEQLGHHYFGKAIRHREDFTHLRQVNPSQPGITPGIYEDDESFGLDHIRQEYPSYGTGDYREPAYIISQFNGSRVTNFVYKSHSIYKGKNKLDGLPSMYVNDDDKVETLEIILEDKLINVCIILSYSIYENYSAITRNVKFINNGNDDINIERAMSMSIDFPSSDYIMTQLSGAWSRERYVYERKLVRGITVIDSKRGTSSATNNPFISLKSKNTTEKNGEIYGFSLVYSGNFASIIEVDQNDVTRVNMGINHFDFNWNLGKNESFQTPEIIMVYSSNGINGMSQTFHNIFNNNVIRGKYKNKSRSVLINNWEATYFDFDEEKIISLARKAKDLGVEMFVLDDGWFGTRNDDYQGLGDWYVNMEKLPNGISGLSKKINDLGMKFGLWFEPEMANKNSNLYREHPDWILSVPDRYDTPSRNQHVLDFSRSEVVDYIYESVSKILKDANIEYIKWDMNRCMTEVFSHTKESKKQKEVAHRYILGLYSLLERITEEFPNILFESCASGGNRFDPGMLYYMPQTWASDNNDAIERIRIQYGTSMVYPISSIGAHVAAVPSHQTGRITSIETRANVAYFGTFGYELDFDKLNVEEQEKVKGQIEFFKQHRDLITTGDFYRIKSPFENNEISWMVVSKDKKEALLAYYKVLAESNHGFKRIYLEGLDANKEYTISTRNKTYYGDELMNLGFLIESKFIGTGHNKEKIGDFYSEIHYIKEK